MTTTVFPTNAPTPVWAEFQVVEAWPTVTIDDGTLGYCIPVPRHWAREPLVERIGNETIHTYRGPTPGDWLSVRQLVPADPSADLADWLGACLSLIGFPVVPPATSQPAVPRLLTWSGARRCADLAERLGAADVRVADGVALGELDSGPAFSRLYVVLARIAERAWNVNLSLFSACPPGASEDLILANDHCRAAAVFGKLRFG